MADGYDGDRLPSFLDPVDDNVLADDETAKVGIDPLGERAPQSRLLRENPGAPEEIRDDPLSSGRIILGEEVEKFGDPFQRGIGPEDLVGHQEE